MLSIWFGISPDNNKKRAIKKKKSENNELWLNNMRGWPPLMFHTAAGPEESKERLDTPPRPIVQLYFFTLLI